MVDLLLARIPRISGNSCPQENRTWAVAGGEAGAWGTAPLPTATEGAESKGTQPHSLPTREHPERRKEGAKLGWGWVEAPVFTQGLSPHWPHPNPVGFSKGMSPGDVGAVGVTRPSPWVAALGGGCARGLQGEVGAQELIPSALNFPKLIPMEQPIPTSRCLRFWDEEEPLKPLGVGSPPSLGPLSVEVSPCPGWDAEIPRTAEFPGWKGWGSVPRPSRAALSWRIST